MSRRHRDQQTIPSLSEQPLTPPQAASIPVTAPTADGIDGVRRRLDEFTDKSKLLIAEMDALAEFRDKFRSAGFGVPTRRFNEEVAGRIDALRSQVRGLYVEAFGDVPEYVDMGR